ncbi:DNA polymerase I [Atopobacter phocae]|uniref:DNA polymerase I n=1 Tax=Atopobacter phocae TaxID=136492 RepID=UPI00047145D2|nr:DNA polymerase I [Atopobacter phocae]
MSKKKLLLVDGSSLMFRAFYAIMNIQSFKTSSGLHTNALFGFVRMLQTVMQIEQPTHVLVAFDAGRTTFRTEKYAEYKGGRKSMPDEMREQLPYFSQLLDAMGIVHYRLDQYEADDIIGTLAHQANAMQMETVILTGDRDLIQLVNEYVRVDITKSGVSELETHTVASLKETMGLRPEQLIDVKALQGDSSDNYKGVTGIGPKTALQLIQTYETLENLYEHVDDMKKSKRKENLQNEKEVAFLAQDLARIRIDAPLDEMITVDRLQLVDQSTSKLIELYRQLNFNQFLQQMPETTLQLWQSEAMAASSAANTTVNNPFTWLEAGDLNRLTALEEVVLWIESLNENYQTGALEAVCFYDVATKETYGLSIELAQSEPVKKWLEDVTIQTFDAKRHWVLAERFMGWPVLTIERDALLEAYITHTDSAHFDPNVTLNQLKDEHYETNESFYGKGAKQKIPADRDKWGAFLAQKMHVIAELLSFLPAQLEQLEQWDLVHNMELPLARVLAKMEIEGIKLNEATLSDLEATFGERLDELEATIQSYATEPFNVKSTKQLGEVLFEQLKLPVIKKTKTGYSTAADVLEKLQGEHPIIDSILTYRMLSKLQSTYVAGLKEAQQSDGRIHTRFIQTLTQTGRLSSADPNLQNIPIRTAEGRLIRQALEPNEPDSVLLASDYSQIELRVLAHISQDQAMQAAFMHGDDIHTLTAMKVFHKESLSEVTALERRQAKAVNFGIVYGISDYGLSQNLNIPRKTAKTFIDNYLKTYPQVEQFMKDVVVEAREKGYVETLFNRRRYLPDLHSSNFNVRSFAERTAMNSPIQGTAADIIKIAMIQIDRHLTEQNYKTTMLLQVHDELVFNVPEDELEEMQRLIPQWMQSAVELAIPLISDTSYGATWYDAK